MKICLVVLGAVLFFSGGMYAWWWFQPVRQVTALTRASAGPMIGSEEFSQEYPELASVMEWFKQDLFDKPSIRGSEVVNQIKGISFTRVFYGLYLMVAGALIFCLPMVFAMFRPGKLASQSEKMSGQTEPAVEGGQR